MKWLRRRRRRRLLATPLPLSWNDILQRNVPFRAQLAEPEKEKLDQAIQVLVAEKNWEGCGGLTVTDEHRVTISAHAARLTLGFDADYFDELQSVLIYPDAYHAETRENLGAGVVLEGPSIRLGEAWYRGPIILAWSDILRSNKQPSNFRHLPRNVVLHEFAHHLDMRNGRMADGVPVIESAEEANEWVHVLDRDYQRLCDNCRHGSDQFLDCYGATNRAEFFAVATEAFFEGPARLAATWPDLFALLRRFYRQSPEESASSPHFS